MDKSVNPEDELWVGIGIAPEHQGKRYDPSGISGKIGNLDAFNTTLKTLIPTHAGKAFPYEISRLQ